MYGSNARLSTLHYLRVPTGREFQRGQLLILQESHGSKRILYSRMIDRRNWLHVQQPFRRVQSRGNFQGVAVARAAIQIVKTPVTDGVCAVSRDDVRAFSTVRRTRNDDDDDDDGTYGLPQK